MKKRSSGVKPSMDFPHFRIPFQVPLQRFGSNAYSQEVHDVLSQSQLPVYAKTRKRLEGTVQFHNLPFIIIAPPVMEAFVQVVSPPMLVVTVGNLVGYGASNGTTVYRVIYPNVEEWRA